MANSWGTLLRISIFGESHGKAVGVVIDGLPAGEEIDLGLIEREMKRRAPSAESWSTTRRETDEVEVISGLYQGRTTGAPICGVIRNRNARPEEYDSVFRPGHADLTAWLKYGGYADMRGGGHFSGRLTAPLVFAGAVAKQILGRQEVEVLGRIAEIAGIADRKEATREERRHAAERSFSVLDQVAGERMREAIETAKEQEDSVGGMVEGVVFGVPSGLGEPFFHSVESEMARLLFSIPAVKGIEFGEGFALARLRGSEANDPIVLRDGAPVTETNRCGGIFGGITSGAPVVVRAAFKPTPTIGIRQDTVDAGSMEPVALVSQGRHDPCIVPRAVPVVEAVMALCILDLLMVDRGRWRQ